MLKKTILAIDDDNDILNIISIILKNRGYTVITDTTGSYIDGMQQNFPDLVILDIELNGHDGRDICKKLKSDKTTAAIPVLFFSANLDLHNICAACNADDYLNKPFEISEFILKVEKLMTPA
jgi:DNA-binding response OmpR family regulator